MTILIWPRLGGYLACWWDPTRSAPYDCKFGPTPAAAVDRLSLAEDVAA